MEVDAQALGHLGVSSFQKIAALAVAECPSGLECKRKTVKEKPSKPS